MNKETALLILRRRLKHLTSTQPDHVSMASRGLGYAERAELVKRTEAEQEESRLELEALTLVMNFFQDNYEEGS